MNRLQRIKGKNSSNLVYSRTKQEEAPKQRSKAFIFLILLLIIGFGYLLFGSTAFQIKTIEVRGYRHRELIENLANEQIGENKLQKNILFFNKKILAQAISGDPRAKEVKIKKILPGKIIIQVKESQPKLIWISEGENYLIDDGGVVIGESGENNLPMVHDGANVKVSPGERVVSPTFIKFIYDIQNGFETATGSKLGKITIFDLITDIHVLSSDGWTVYFNASKSSESQLNNLSKVLGEARNEQKKLEYIDMRLENKIFYK